MDAFVDENNMDLYIDGSCIQGNLNLQPMNMIISWMLMNMHKTTFFVSSNN